jgi:hypothetical protein
LNKSKKTKIKTKKIKKWVWSTKKNTEVGKIEIIIITLNIVFTKKIAKIKIKIFINAFIKIKKIKIAFSKVRKFKKVKTKNKDKKIKHIEQGGDGT